MCKAFSCLIDFTGKTTWKLGIDSHSELVTMAGYKDQTANPVELEFARVEITPNNGNYLAPDDWTLKVDEAIRPTWFVEKHETACHIAHKKWLKQLDKIIVHKEIVNPFKLKPPKITKAHIALLQEWDSVGASVGASVWASVGASVRASVRASVGASVGALVWDSVEASVWASVWDYTGSLFVPKIKEWRYAEKCGRNPWKPCADLWRMGYVASFDGKTWRLHCGPKAEVKYEFTAEEVAGKEAATGGEEGK
jgi:hypothetical protein